jgi:CheY-like chemotaxis protein
MTILAACVGLLLLGKTLVVFFKLVRGTLNPWSLVPAAPIEAKVLLNGDAVSKIKELFQPAPDKVAEMPLAAPIVEPVAAVEEERKDPLQEFFDWVPGHVVMLRKLHQTISRTAVEDHLEEKLRELRSHIGALRAKTDLPELAPVKQMSTALEGLVKQLGDDLRDVTPSTMRTVATGIDLLADLCTPALRADLATNPPIQILAVDDDPISRIAIAFALKKSFDQPNLAEDGEAALALAATQPFDVIFLDVQMPGMDGFELCSKIHESEANRTTPVVFVTSMKDFAARAKSITSGGSDLIGKPFLTFEIAVKALSLVLRRRLPASKPVLEVAPAPAVKPSAPAQVAKPSPVNQDSGEAQEQLKALHLEVKSLTRELNPETFRPALKLVSALESMFRKLQEQPKNATPSTLSTARSAMELIKDLSVPGVDPELAANPPVSILVIDVEPIARRAVVGALQLAFLKPENVGDGESAVAVAAEKKFDMIFMDVEMPGMDGYATCRNIHETSLNRHTPVVFVTSHADLETRAKCLAAGGGDFVAKPIVLVEIIVKALTYALRGRLQNEASLAAAR